ncbi:MAG: hypothetical protein ACKVOP_07840 [Sphingomonadaceae bacterium]
MSILPVYPIPWSGSWGSQTGLSVEMYQMGDDSFCLLKSAVGETEVGVEYRIGFSFGDRNEVRIVSEAELRPTGDVALTFSNGSIFDLRSPDYTSHGTSKVIIYEMSRSMIALVLGDIKESHTGQLKMPVQFGTQTFNLDLRQREAVFRDARDCDNDRLGKVLPD